MKQGESTIVSRYARALFQSALEKQLLTAVRTDLQNLHLLWVEQTELRLLLMNPGLTRQKVDGILGLLGDKLGLNALTRRFLEVLLDKDRLGIIAAVHPVFEKLVFAHEGKIAVTVTTAVPVAGSVQEQIVTHLKQKSGKEPVVAWQQNSQLLGGVVIEWPDHVFDGSLARKLQNMELLLTGTA